MAITATIQSSVDHLGEGLAVYMGGEGQGSELGLNSLLPSLAV